MTPKSALNSAAKKNVLQERENDVSVQPAKGRFRDPRELKLRQLQRRQAEKNHVFVAPSPRRSARTPSKPPAIAISHASTPRKSPRSATKHLALPAPPISCIAVAKTPSKPVQKQNRNVFHKSPAPKKPPQKRSFMSAMKTRLEREDEEEEEGEGEEEKTGFFNEENESENENDEQMGGVSVRVTRSSAKKRSDGRKEVHFAKPEPFALPAPPTHESKQLALFSDTKSLAVVPVQVGKKTLHEEISDLMATPAQKTPAHKKRRRFEPTYSADSAMRPLLPLDLSIKKSIRFTSAERFDWCAQLRSKTNTVGLTNFTRCLPDNEILQCSPQQYDEATMKPHALSALQKAMLYWHYTVPTGDSAPSQSTQSDWALCLQSLYELVRDGRCPYFYVELLTQTVVITGPGVNGSSGIEARLSTSTEGFRSVLRREGITDYDLPYRRDGPTRPMHYDSESEGERDSSLQANSREAMAGEERMVVQLPYQTGGRDRDTDDSALDNTLDSMLLFRGHTVHQLYEYLLNNGRSRAISIQAFYAPVAFYAAQLGSLTIKQNGQVTRPANDQKPTSEYMVEIEGVILPTNLMRIFNVFWLTQGGTMEASFKIHGWTAGFNGGTPQISESQQHMRSRISAESAKMYGLEPPEGAFLGTPSPLHRNPLKRVKCENGILHC